MIKVYVWYGKSSCVTGKAIRESLKLDESLYVRGGVKPPKKQYDCVVVWGLAYAGVYQHIGHARLIGNQPELVQLFSNKFNALQKMQASGVCVPKHGKTTDSLSLPILERPDYHTRGRGFALYRDAMPTVRVGHHYQQFVQSDREYRVHVWQGKVIRVQRKVAITSDADTSCRSHGNGWRFSLCDIERVRGDIKSQAVEAVRALSYQHGAVDVLVSGNMATVLEVNSGCGLDSKGLSLYVTLLSEAIKNI